MGKRISSVCYSFLVEVSNDNIMTYPSKKDKSTLVFTGKERSLDTGRLWTSLASSISGRPALRKGYIELTEYGEVKLTPVGLGVVLDYVGKE